MLKRLSLTSFAVAMLFASAANARDDLLEFKIQDALTSPAAAGKVDQSVRLYWGKQTFPKPLQTFGEFTANKKTNAFNKSNQKGCDWNFLSAVISLQGRAKSEGGNAVVNIHSVYKNKDFVSETEYQCGAGAFVSGAALRGTVVKLP